MAVETEREDLDAHASKRELHGDTDLSQVQTPHELCVPEL